jgi:phage-related protein
MPGDINTYSLGIEFNLTATQAINTLQTLENKVANIEQSLSKAFQVNVDTAGVQEVEKTTEAATTASKIWGEAIQTDISTIEDMNKLLDEQVSSQGDLKKLMDQNANIIKELVERRQKLVKIYGEEDPEVQKLSKSLEGLQDKYKNTKKRTEEAKKESELFTDILSKATGISGKTLGNIAKLADGLGLVPDSLREAMPGFFDFGDSVKDFTASAGGGADHLGNISEKGNEAVSAMGEMGEAIPTDIAETIGGEAAAQGLTAAADAGQAAAAGTQAAGAGAASAGAGAAAAAGPVALLAVAMEVADAAAQAVASALGELGANASSSGQAMMDAVQSGNIFGAMLAFVKAGIIDFIAAQDEFRTVTYRQIGSVNDAVDASMHLREELNLTADEANEVISAMVETGAAMVMAGDEFTEAAETVSKFTVATGISADVSSDLMRIMKAQTGSTAAGTRTLGRFTTAMKAMGMSAQEAQEILADLVAMAPELNALFDDKAVEDYGDAMLLLTAQFKEMGGGVEQAREFMKAVADDESDLAIMTGIAYAEFDNMEERVNTAIERLPDLVAGWEGTSAGLRQMLAGMPGLSAATTDLIVKMQAEGATLDELREKFGGAVDEMKAQEEMNKSFEESIGTIKQQFMRLMEPILAVISKGMKPLGDAIGVVMSVLNPMIDAFVWFYDLLESLGVIKGLIVGIAAVFGVLGAVIAAVAASALALLSPIIIGITTLGMALYAVYKVAKIVFAPLIWAAKVVWNILKAIWNVITDVAGAIKEGIGEAWNEVMAPIKEALGEIDKAFTELKKALGMNEEETESWGKKLAKITKVVAKVFAFLFKPIAVGAKIVAGAIGLVADVIRALIKPIKDVKKWIFGSGLFGIDKAIAVVKAPLNWVWNIFKKIGAIVKKVAEIASKPFKAVVAGAKAAAKGALSLAEKIPVVGKAAGWIKKKLFGSGLFGIDVGVIGAMKFMKKFGSAFGLIGKSIMEQFPVIGGFFSRIINPMSDIDKMMMTRGKRAVDPTEVMTATEKITYMLTGKIPDRAKGVADAMNKEMGRETKAEKELREMKEKLDKLIGPLYGIMDLLSDSEGSKAIKKLLEQYLPKMAERPSELGPAISTW